MAAESPQTVIQSGTDQILKILKQYPQDTRARRQQIQAVVNRYFDFEAISRLAIGPRWRSLTPEERQRFTMEFSKLLYYKYIGDIEKYATQRIAYNNRSVYPGYVVVEARVMGQQGPMSIDYYLHMRDGNWKVYDVGVQGMSLVSNYRQQFDAILASSSFNTLSRMLEQQIAQTCGYRSC